MNMKYLLIMLLAVIANLAWADEGVDITDPIQVSELRALQEIIDSVSTAIMECMDSGREHKACMCKHSALVIQFNTSVNNLFLNQPGLEELDIVRFRASDGTWVSQSLEGIRKQASVELLCT